MGNIWVKEFTGGLDTRRLPETTAGGVLIKAKNGHISRGGEFEKRAAFVSTYSLPAGTVGLAEDGVNLFVFGSDPEPAGIPSGVEYQRLQHPDGVTELVSLLSFDLYAGKVYAVGEFADGAIFHFYDGTRVADWYDGRSRATFEVTEGSVTPASAAKGSFEITGGTADSANTITSVKIDGVNLINLPVEHTGNNATTAEAVAAAINSYASVPNYTASVNGQSVVIEASATGPTPNGKAIIVAITGDVTTANATTMSGGADAVVSTLNDLQVDGVSIINAAVQWSTSNEATAENIAAAVNTFTSNPDYTAVAIGPSVSIVAGATGAAANGRVITFDLANGMSVSPSSGLTLANGSDNSETYQPGTYVKTIGSKMYSVSGPNMHFSGIKEPTKWTTDAVGAGFVDMSVEASGSENLVALAKYQNFIAVFAERVTQVWYVDPDPDLNRQTQVLNNTGTISPKSVTQFGDSDLFYLDESGLRSLRARDSSNAASTTDIGVLIDTLVIAKLAELSFDERRNVIGLIEPRDGRFWLIAKDAIYVFSFFPGSKVSAWSTYAPGMIDANGDEILFGIDNAVVFNRRVYVRSGDTIYAYGGTGADPQYDATVAEAWLPYLDAGVPARQKRWLGVDAALTGTWEVSVGMQPTDVSAEDKIGLLWETTFNQARISQIGESTHVSLRFRSVSDGPAKLSSAVIHYEGDADED